jgi:hypothetical protein
MQGFVLTSKISGPLELMIHDVLDKTCKLQDGSPLDQLYIHLLQKTKVSIDAYSYTRSPDA